LKVALVSGGWARHGVGSNADTSGTGICSGAVVAIVTSGTCQRLVLTITVSVTGTDRGVTIGGRCQTNHRDTLAGSSCAAVALGAGVSIVTSRVG